MTQRSNNKDMVVAHRKVRVASTRNRKDLKRSTGKKTTSKSASKTPKAKTETENAVTKTKTTKAKVTKVEVTKVKTATTKVTAEKAPKAKQSKQIAKVVDKSKVEKIKVTKKSTKKKTSEPIKAKRSSETKKLPGTKKPLEEKKLAEAKRSPEEKKSPETEKPLESKREEKTEISKLTSVELNRADRGSQILIREEQYREKRPLNAISKSSTAAGVEETSSLETTKSEKVVDTTKTVEPARISQKAEPAKIEKSEKATVKPEQVGEYKSDSALTAQKNLEAQAEFWSKLAIPEPEPTKSLVVKVPTPKPVDMTKVDQRMRARTSIPIEQPSATGKELKERAIKKALASAEKSPSVPSHKTKKADRVRFTWGRILLAFSCTVAAVSAIVYFVNLSAPDISLKVAAMQSGIEATYPSYTPRDYSLSDITSENDKITLSFRSNDGKSTYVLTEEKSSWDSNALLTNFIKDTYGEDYTAVREQGLTIYIANDGAAWVNGGILYKLKVSLGSLTKKQIKTIATSL